MRKAIISRHRWPWWCFQIGIFLLPIFSGGGTSVLFLVMLGIWQQAYRLLIRYPLNWGFALLSLWLLAASGFAFQPIEALEGLANFIPFFAVFGAFSFLLDNFSRLRQLAWLIVIPSLPAVILGLGQLYGGWEMRWLGIKLIAGGEPAGRMSSLFMYANIFAAYLLIAFTLGLGLAIDAYQMGWRGVRREPGWRLFFLILMLIMAIIGLILTDSRNAWGLACLTSLAFALYLGWRWLVVAIGLAAGTVAWAAWGPSFGRDTLRQLVPAYFWQRLSDEMYDRPEITLRGTQWQFAWDMMQQRPWVGWGLRNFSPLYKAEMGVWLGHPHNFFLMLLAEMGIPATLILCGLVGWVIFQAARLLLLWQSATSKHRRQKNHLLLFTYLLAFGSCCLFNLFDVTIFDLRLNLIGWILLSAISGIVYRYRRQLH